ncbi:MAG: OFA family MFS transporter [Alkaliphilus sp.]
MGTSNNFVLTRWSIPFAGFLLALMGGIAYAWGVFITPMVNRFGWTNAQAALPFTVYVLFLTIASVFGGKYQDKIGPGKVSAIGAALFIVAYGLASLVGHFPHFMWLVVTYGVIGGSACGLTYSCVAPPARKWFPDKPGFAISLGVMGFGLAAVVFAPLKADTLIPSIGIENTFLLIGALSAIISLFAAWLIRNPEPGWVPEGFEDDKKDHKTTDIRSESSPKQMLKSPIFYILWLSFFLVIAGGLMCIGLIPTFGKKILGLSPVEAALAVSIFAGFNGLGRPLAGYLGDKVGIVWVMIATYALQAAAFIFFPVFATTKITLYLASAIFGWGFAVTLAVFPALTAINFGVKNLGVNYGLILTAFGIGGIAPAIGSMIYDRTLSFTPTFIAAGVMTAIGLLLCFVLKKKYDLA